MSENLPNLYYSSENRPRSLPGWAYFFIRLGYQLAMIPSDECRVVIGLSIPARSFSSGLIGVGIVFATADSENHIDEVQLQYVRSLKSGTPVHVRIGTRKYKGIIQQFENIGGREHVVIRTTKANSHATPLERKLPLIQYASRITISENDVKLSGKQSGQPTESPSGFLQNCLGKELAGEFIHNSSFEALIVGRKASIQHEICDIPFMCQSHSDSDCAQGTLQEILRVRQFSGANRAFRTQITSSSNIDPVEDIGTHKPPNVIFDGAVAYTKLCHHWPSAHHVVILDRTERQFADACHLLNQNYTYRLADPVEFPINIPSGIEMMLFTEGV